MYVRISQFLFSAAKKQKTKKYSSIIFFTDVLMLFPPHFQLSFFYQCDVPPDCDNGGFFGLCVIPQMTTRGRSVHFSVLLHLHQTERLSIH